MKYLNELKNDYEGVTDLIIKNINGVYIIYIESLCSQDKINNYILKTLTVNKGKNIKELIPSPKLMEIQDYCDLLNYLNNGFAIILCDEEFAIEVKLELVRSISDATSETVMFGPKESLVENIQTNFGLIKRRIKSNRLKNINIDIGSYSKTSSSILYIDNIVNKDLVKNISSKLRNINISGIKDIGELKQALINENKNVFPSIRLTERPDVIEEALINGKVIILLDTSPYALIVPSVFADFINPVSDDYSKPINVNFNKILRLLCFFLAIILPSLYVALTTYNQETIPINLLMSFQEQRMKVPYPSYIECALVLIICEILKESDLRFPSSYGSAISILGAVTLGDAAVNAGIVSPIMIIVVAFSFIASMIFIDNDMSNGIRIFRFIFLIISSIFGLYGIFISVILLLTYLVSKETFRVPYFYPISPFDKDYFKDTILKLKNNKRSKYLSKNRIKGDL